MPIMPILVLIAAASSAGPAGAVRPRPCAAAAPARALKLLRFHSNGDARAAIEPSSVRRIGTVAALAGGHRFDVIEVLGHVYRTAYRLRLIYAPMPGGGCTLMGQEVLEASDPY